jgi:hypothetical protein
MGIQLSECIKHPESHVERSTPFCPTLPDRFEVGPAWRDRFSEDRQDLLGHRREALKSAGRAVHALLTQPNSLKFLIP